MDPMSSALDALDTEFADIAADAVPLDDYDLSALASGFARHPPEVVRALTPLMLRKVIVGEIHPLESFLGEVLDRGWHGGWESREGTALHRFLVLWWETTLTRYPGERTADDLLELLLPLHDDARPLLDIWEAISTEASDHHLADLIRWQVPDLLNGTRLILDQGSVHDHRAQFISWLTRYGLARITLRRDTPGHFGRALALLEHLAAMD